ncbi:MAG: polysulfide reductase NrfD [Proteobacteria bacterium]|jgi:Ni/Fe-hydrogenase subunit HybB-like protein|nr:polysulfide reductase NrfD [Pseudomonadota bacterium]
MSTSLNTSDKELKPTFLRFLLHSLGTVTDGGVAYWVWMVILVATALIGLNAWAYQVANGLGVTAMSDHVSWGMYIGNFTYGVGLAAGAVMVVIPTYLYGDHAMHHVVVVGEILAISAISVCVLFVGADLGRIDRAWHMAPGLGEMNFPSSLLTWDVAVLNVYFFLNLTMVVYVLFQYYRGRKPAKKIVVPLALVSIVWAISIHVVTAFLYSGLGGRPFWNTALLAPRFIVSAFITGPAFLILAFVAIRYFTDFKVGSGPFRTLHRVLQVTVLLNLFFLISELFTEFYAGTSHSASAHYLFFGHGDATALVPFIWTAVVFNIVAAIAMLLGDPEKRLWLIGLGCVLSLIGVWVEKGLGLIVPGFVPSTLHEVVEYLPNLVEWKITLGLWAFGLILFTAGLKIAFTVLPRSSSVSREF